MYVGGCSGGGVLSSWVIGHTDRFAAAAVRCPVIDWLAFAGETDIPLFTYNFFEKPFWEDPMPWLKHSSLMYVGNVKTPTMLMTGVLDQRTPMPQTEEYYSALKMRGVPAVLLRFENEWHGTGSRPSNWMRTQLYMMSWYRKWGGAAAAAMGTGSTEEGVRSREGKDEGEREAAGGNGPLTACAPLTSPLSLLTSHCSYGLGYLCSHCRSSSSTRATYTVPFPKPTTRLFGLSITFLTSAPVLSNTS